MFDAAELGLHRSVKIGLVANSTALLSKASSLSAISSFKPKDASKLAPSRRKRLSRSGQHR